MHIAILTFTFSLPGCSSLKEKRQRVGGLHERFGRNPAVAVCESGELIRHDASQWSFVVEIDVDIIILRRFAYQGFKNVIQL